MVATCVDIEEEEIGEHFVETGLKRNQRPRDYPFGQIHHVPKKKLILIVQIGEQRYRIRIDDLFMEKICKPGKRRANLTLPRVNKIKRTMPGQVIVNQTNDPVFPYELDRASFDAWFNNINW